MGSLCVIHLCLSKAKLSQFTVNSSVGHTKESRAAVLSVLSLKTLLHKHTHTHKKREKNIWFEIFQHVFQLR